MVRPNELSFARRGALNKLAARRQGARPSQLTAVFVGLDPEDDSRAIVSFDGSEVSVLAGPVKMIPGALCAVEVDSANAPVRVLGPVTTRPEGLDEDVPTPDAVMPMPELGPRELTEAEAQAIQDTADGLAQAQAELEDARTEAEQNFGTLDDKLGQAFPDSVFDVNVAIEQAKDLAEQQFNDSITGTVVEYALSDSEVEAPTTGWSTTAPARTPGTFIWMRTTVSYGSGDATTTDPVLVTGNAGSTGAQGVSVTSITPHFRRLADSEAKPAKPTGMTPSGWVEVEPDYDRDTTMWRSDRIVFSNGQVTWTDVSKSSSYEAAKAAEAAALAYADEKKQEAIDAGAIDLANLQIGGRNLLRTSPLSVDDWVEYDHVGSHSHYFQEYTGFQVEAGQTYTFSWDYEHISGVDVTFELGLGHNPKGFTRDVLTSSGNRLPVMSTRSSLTFTITEHEMRDSHTWLAYRMRHGQYNDSHFRVRRLKLEKGTKATDWTPAPEDVDAGIADAQALATTADGKADTAQQVAATADGKATTAVAEAGTAKTNAATALSTANEADTKAGQAITTAGQADTKAGQAVTTAGQANTAAQNAVATASAASTAASNARAVADDALSKYGPLDQRTINAQAAADAAATAAGLAQARADSAHSQATSAGTAASQAMTTADGKNTTSYKTVTTTPGPAPTNNVEGKNRRQFDMHRNRLSNGTIVGEWMWSGTSWVQVHMGDGILRSLDVGKLSAGTANIETGVVNKLWGQLGVFDKLDVRTDAYISGINLKDGAVTSRTLNVVPEEGTGGLKLDAYGMDVVGPDTGEAATFVSFRADQDNAISFVQDDKSTFSVSPAGDLTAQTVAANTDFTFRGEPLSTVLGRLNQGVVSSSVSHLMQEIQMDGSERTILKVNVPARDPALGSRNLVVRFQIYTDRSDVPFAIRIRHTQDGSNVSVSSPLYQEFTTQARVGLLSGSIPAQVEAGVEWNVLISGYSGAGCVLRPGAVTHAYVEDLGHAVPWDYQYPPGAGSGGSETTPTPEPTKLVTKTFSPTWTRSFWGDGSFYNRGPGRAYHGQYLAATGILGSAVGFNRTEIASHVASGEIVKVEVFLKNSHTYSSAGMSAQWGTHGHTSAPSSYSVPTGGYTDLFKSGEGKWITLPESGWAYWKTGGSNGIRFKPSSSSQMSYGYFDGTATRVRITVRK